MKYQLPHAVYTAFDETTKLYTATQVQAAYTAGRAAGLEASVDVILNFQSGWVPDGFTECADAIRNLATNLTTGETK